MSRFVGKLAVDPPCEFPKFESETLTKCHEKLLTEERRSRDSERFVFLLKAPGYPSHDGAEVPLS